jgi:membrane-bound lytic murein transglycosylase B
LTTDTETDKAQENTSSGEEEMTQKTKNIARICAFATFTLFIMLFIIILFSSKISLLSFESTDINAKIGFFAPAVEKFITAGGDSAFIYKIISNPQTAFNERYVKVYLGWSVKRADYSHFYNSRSIDGAKEFLEEFKSVFDSCEKIIPVPRDIIAAIIWIETRNGSYLGNHPVASVFLSAALADRSDFVEQNAAAARKLFSSRIESSNNPDSVRRAVDEQIRVRSDKKVAWAVDELLALQKIEKSTGADALSIRGSYAGAFGIPQFMPSSYLRWGRDGDGDGAVDLFNPADAIFSAANYLHSNGWDSTVVGQRAALYHYNNSESYVDAALNLAARAR